MNTTILLLILAASPAVAEDLPLATVNGESIRPADLERHLARIHMSADRTDRSSFDTDRLMFKLINDVLIGQEARAAGFDEDPRIAEQLAEHRDELILAHLEKVEIADNVEPDDESVRGLFEEQYGEIQLRIVTAEEESDARAILDDLLGGADMEAIAKERSVDHVSARGGLMRPAARVSLPRSVADAAAGLTVGEFGGPVQTDLGWTVFRVEHMAPADPAKFDDLEARLRSVVAAERARGLRAALARTAREHHEVVLEREIIDRIRPQRQPDGRLTAEAAEPGRVVARIGQRRSVTAGNYAQALGKRWKGVRSEQAAVAAAPIILNTLVERELLVAEGERRGYGDLPEVQARLRARETQLLVPRYLEDVVAAEIEVEPEEMQTYYLEHKNEFLRPPRIRLGQITTATREEAERVAGMLRGGADLAWVAERHSTDGYKQAGGIRGWVVPTPGLDTFQDLLLRSSTGEVLDPFGEPGSYIVLKIVAREEQGPFEFEQVSGNVRQALFEEKSRVALDRFISTLRERSEIVVFDDRVKALTITGAVTEPTEEEGAAGGHGH